jgi:hypothetical protein
MCSACQYSTGFAGTISFFSLARVADALLTRAFFARETFLDAAVASPELVLIFFLLVVVDITAPCLDLRSSASAVADALSKRVGR